MSMTTMLQATKKQDEWHTPDYAVKVLLPFLPRKSKILCPFDKVDSAFVQELYFNADAGHDVRFSHINGDGKGYNKRDFFTYTEKDVKDVDFIISNPPYSLKDAVFEKLFELGRPFCMLMGSTTGLFEGKRFSLWKEHNNYLTVIWLSPRVSYIDQNGVAMKSPPFQSCYVCWHLPQGYKGTGHHFVRLEKQ